MQLELRDAARLLGVDESDVLRWIKRGELTARRVHDQYQFNRVDLIEFAAERGIAIPAELANGPAPAALPGLADAVRAGGVHAGVAAADKATALREVVERLPVPPGTDRAFLLQMLVAREQLGSTGLGNGIAIPHPRNPIVLRVQGPSVSVCYLASPVDFGALDGRPVHTLFTIVAPSVRVHLHLLALLATALRDPTVQARVAARAPQAELVEAIAALEARLPRPASGEHLP